MVLCACHFPKSRLPHEADALPIQGSHLHHCLLILTLCMSYVQASEGVLSGPVKVEVVGENGQYQLLRGGQPYEVKGVGSNISNFASLKALGGNSIRTIPAGTNSTSRIKCELNPVRAVLNRTAFLTTIKSLCFPHRKTEQSGWSKTDLIDKQTSITYEVPPIEYLQMEQPWAKDRFQSTRRICENSLVTRLG